MSSEDNCLRHNSSGWDMFQDDSKFSSQFSSGIKTIAALPLEPQGVVQFGSIEKIMEKTEFINQTKRVFNETVNGNVPTNSSHSPSGLFASLISNEDSYFGNGGQYSISQSSMAFPPQSFSFEVLRRYILKNGMHNGRPSLTAVMLIDFGTSSSMCLWIENTRVREALINPQERKWFCWRRDGNRVYRTWFPTKVGTERYIHNAQGTI